jgi:hypothetical protein
VTEPDTYAVLAGEYLTRLELAFARDDVHDLHGAAVALRHLGDCLTELGTPTARVDRLARLLGEIRERALLDFPPMAEA